MKTQHFSTHTVLWADDDPDDLFIMREVLERTDPAHHVIEAYNGQEVLRVLDQYEYPAEYPCLIILDMNMPVLDGRQTIKQIREQAKYQSIPIVVFTTSSSERDKAFCHFYGVQMYTKPSALNELEKTILKILGHCNKVAGQESCLPYARNGL